VKLKHIIKENGQAMVEFALVLPILLLFIGGIIDFGWIFHNQLAANNASREAARYIAIHYKVTNDPIYNDLDDARDKAEEIILRTVSTVKQVTVTHSDDGGEYLKVELSRNVKILTPLLQLIIDGDDDGYYVVKAECTMRVEK
jgi:Flp pilus assembly protein TadG